MKHWLYKSRWRLLPGLLAAGITLLTARMGTLQPLENGVYRTLFNLRGEQPWDDRVAVIEIDEASLDAIGEFPWPRHYYTALLKQITTPTGPSVIAFDILFDNSSADDNELAMAMTQHGNVVLATAWDEQRGVIGPNARVMEGAIATGHIHHNADADGITRAYQPKLNGTLALSLTVIQHYKPHTSNNNVHNFSQALWLNWRGFSQNAPRYSFVEVLTGQIPVESFTNKIVFIGFTGTDLDTMITPYNQTPPAAGVYQHIVAVNNLLAHDHLRPIVLPVWALLVLFSPILGEQIFYRRLHIQVLVSLTVISIWSSVVIFAFSYNYWIPTTAPVTSIATTSLLVRLTETLQSKIKSKLKLKQARGLASHETRPISLKLCSHAYSDHVLVSNDGQ